MKFIPYNHDMLISVDLFYYMRKYANFERCNTRGHYPVLTVFAFPE